MIKNILIVAVITLNVTLEISGADQPPIYEKSFNSIQFNLPLYEESIVDSPPTAQVPVQQVTQKDGCCADFMRGCNENCSIDKGIRVTACACAPISCIVAVAGGAVGGCYARQRLFGQGFQRTVDKNAEAEQNCCSVCCLLCCTCGVVIPIFWPLSMLQGAVEGMVWTPRQLFQYIRNGEIETNGDWHKLFLPKLAYSAKEREFYGVND